MLAVFLAGCTGQAGTAAPPARAAATPPQTRWATSQPPSDGPTALTALARLPVKGRSPRTGYARAQFGQAWTDDVDVPLGHDGCDTRNGILGRDLIAVTFKPRTRDCVVLAGTLHDPYTGQTISFRRGPESSAEVQIDHVVSLADAWQTGAQALTRDQRVNLANDPLDLLAVDGPTNQAKGDSDAASWLPPNAHYRCAYVARQIAVKARYRLWVTPAEHDAIARVLSRCPGQLLPEDPDPES